MGTTVAELFGDLGHDLDDELKRLTRDHGGISGQVYRLLQRRFGEAVAAVLDIDLGSLALDGWAKYDEVREAARRSVLPGAPPERVRLLEHRITSTHKPTIELYVDNALLTTISLGLEVEVDVHGLDAEIEAGRLAGLRSGDLDVRARLSIEGHRIGEREHSYEVGKLLPVGDGIPLTEPLPVPSEPTHRPPRPNRLRGVLTVAALIVVFGLGGVVTRSVEWTSTWPPLQPGTTGQVRPGSEWFVRSGPSRLSPDVATIAPGQPVRVTCLIRGWAKLLSPHEGNYVYSRGLSLNTTPPACPA